ncbi:MAG: hypothetical protein HN509_18560 [Halobacteriovoraceae bacterium]|jgi:hypothetical protein|nr:hypothetical protein [Halobacteriovoraceae bacterium]
MKLCVLLIFSSLFSKSYAQDERFYRELLTGELLSKKARKYNPPPKYKARTPFYEVDLNSDDRNERFYYEKKGGEDFLVIQNYKRQEIFRYKFETIGINARLYRLSIRRISAKTKVVVLNFYEGYTNYLEFNGSARVYLMSIDNNDLSTMAVYKGPGFWQEFRGFKGDYRQRFYELSLYDFNGDGIKEVIVRHHLIPRVLMYLDDGKWSNIHDYIRRISRVNAKGK